MVFSCLLLVLSAAALAACNRMMPGKLKLANPAKPSCMNPRRFVASSLFGPGQHVCDEVFLDWLILSPQLSREWQWVLTQ